jgi:hypothetical protein
MRISKVCVVCRAIAIANNISCCKIVTNAKYIKEEDVPFVRWYYRNDTNVAKNIKNGRVCKKHRLDRVDMINQRKEYNNLPITESNESQLESILQDEPQSKNTTVTQQYGHGIHIRNDDGMNSIYCKTVVPETDAQQEVYRLLFPKSITIKGNDAFVGCGLLCGEWARKAPKFIPNINPEDPTINITEHAFMCLSKVYNSSGRKKDIGFKWDQKRHTTAISLGMWTEQGHSNKGLIETASQKKLKENYPDFFQLISSSLYPIFKYGFLPYVQKFYPALYEIWFDNADLDQNIRELTLPCIIFINFYNFEEESTTSTGQVHKDPDARAAHALLTTLGDPSDMYHGGELNVVNANVQITMEPRDITSIASFKLKHQCCTVTGKRITIVVTIHDDMFIIREKQQATKTKRDSMLSLHYI